MSDNTNNIFYNKTDLIYDDQVSTNNIENVLLIDSAVKNHTIFWTASNENTLPIIYSVTSDRQELLDLLTNKFTNIKRIGLAFHTYTQNNYQMFLNMDPLFTSSDLSCNIDLSNNIYSSGCSFIIDIIKRFSVVNIDFLACNTLNYDKWLAFYNILDAKTNVIVGASNDDTGNILYGGDWVMESTKEDIQNIYFTSDISNYHETLFNVTINDGVTQIGDYAYYGQSYLESVYIPASVTYIGVLAFYACEYYFTSVTIPPSVSLGSSAFAVCKQLQTVTFTSPYKIYGQLYENDSYMEDTIGWGVFSNLQTITSFTIPDTIKYIANYALCNMYMVVSIVIPSSVLHVYDFAFSGFYSLTNLTLSTSTVFDTNAFRLTFYFQYDTPAVISTITMLGDIDMYKSCYALINNSSAQTIYYQPNANGWTDMQNALTNKTFVPLSGTSGGDPHITTIHGETYDLPHIDGIFMLFNNMNNFKVACECMHLTEEEINSSTFQNELLYDTTFMTHIYIYYNDEIVYVDLNTLKYKVNNKETKQNIIFSNIYEDKYVLKKYYNNNKSLYNKIKYNGKSRNITIGDYNIKVSVDLNCADHRNDVVISGKNMTGYGAIISSSHKSLLMKY